MTCMFIAMTNKEKLTDPIFSDEAAKLKNIFGEYQQAQRAKGLKFSQRDIAESAGWSQTNVANYLNGYSPLNANAASIFARNLECSVLAFSPRLHNQIILQATNSDVVINNIRNVNEVLVYDSKNLDSFLGFIKNGDAMPQAVKKEYLTGDVPDGIFGFLQPDDSLDDGLNEKHEGDTYIIDKNREVKPGNLVLARVGDGVYELRRIKLIEVDDNSNPVVCELTPINPNYPRRTVNLKTSSVKIIGVAIKNISNLVDN